ncbi:MAG: type II toxin-antitoxin system HigB family toxin [Ginsengibacter sp.]
MFNIITRRTLIEYLDRYPQAAFALAKWYSELKDENFIDFNELKKVYGNASLIGDNRVIFNIMGNKYRLVVRIIFEYKVVQIKWFGTHKEYNKIDPKIIQYKNHSL